MERKWSNVEFQNEDNICMFLENFEFAAKRVASKQQKMKKELENDLKTIRDEKPLNAEKQSQMSRNVIESLYIEALYTIKHRIGKTIDGHNDYINDLYSYVQEAFKISPQDHERLVLKASEEKPPVVILIVEVVEAKNLEAKDANGFSDPYCHLGIIPGNRSLEHIEENCVSDDENKTHALTRKLSKPEQSKGGFIKRFSSFRRSEKTVKTKTSNKLGAIRDGKLPAKYIQSTDVKKATLNPVWMEKFRFKIDSIDSDMLHLDIWDHDDEFSVFEAARKLNEIKGLKGLDRYFKQIAQSARANKADKDSHVDDFLGAINISLNNIPSNGIDKWFDLEGRTEKSKVEGKIRLRLNLATREDRGLFDEDNWADLRQQEQLLSIFIDYELSKFSGKNCLWNGELSKEAETILHQHAIQGDLTEEQIAMSRWIAYSKKHLERNLSHDLLYNVLDKFSSVWKPTSSSRDEMDSLRDSFTLITKHCFKLISKLRDAFPISKSSLERLELILRLLDKIYKIEVFKYCCPFQNSINHEVSQILKTGTIEWFDKVSKQYIPNKSDDDNIKKIVDLTGIMLFDSYIGVKYYKPIFEKELNLQYFPIVFKIIDLKLFELTASTFIEEFGDEFNSEKPLTTSTTATTETISTNTTNNEQPPSPKDAKTGCKPLNKSSGISPYGVVTDQMAINLFELYVSLQELSSFRHYIDETHRSNLKILKFHQIFLAPLKQWIELIQHKLDIKIEKFLEMEKTENFTEFTKFSSSSVELTNCFSKISQFWKSVCWPDQAGSIIYASQMLNQMSKSAIRYAAIIMEVNGQTNEKSTSPKSKTPIQTNDPKMFQKQCVAINSIERVRESLKSLQFELEHVKTPKDKSNEPLALDTAASSAANETLINFIEQIIETLTNNQMQNEMQSHMFYFIESPESVPAKDSISRLIQFLDSNLVSFKDSLIKSNFDRSLRIIWEKLLEMMIASIIKDDSRTAIFYIKVDEALNTLIDFLNADNQGLSKDCLKSLEQYKDIKKIIKYGQTETSKLILMYYQEMISIQNSIKTNEFGKIYCRAYYNLKEETLIVEVNKCKNLKPMDQNGLSDPYVEVEFKPKYLFSNVDKKTTSIVKKNLNPVFEETFEFKIPEKLLHIPGAVIHFTVMDHDLMWSNDFEGEAFVDLTTVPAGNNNHHSQDFKSFDLWLIEPKSYPTRIWDALELRVHDKLAMEFIKFRKDKVKA